MVICPMISFRASKTEKYMRPLDVDAIAAAN